MMKPVLRVDGRDACPMSGSPVLDPAKALWNAIMLLGSAIFAMPLFSWSAFILFLIATYGSLLIGHSVGMHRLMIHRTFECPKPLERFLI